MSTNYTANYRLCQWEASDKVLHTDFNEDNAKLDAALAGLARRASTLEGRASAMEGSAYTVDNPQVVVGTYKGDGKKTRGISLGFRPRVVLSLVKTLKPCSDMYFTCGLAVDGLFSTALAITSSGFEVYEEEGDVWTRTNRDGETFVYFAFK